MITYKGTKLITNIVHHKQKLVVCSSSRSTFTCPHQQWSTLYTEVRQTKAGRLSTSSATLALICLLATVHLLLLLFLPPLTLPLLLAYYFCCFSRKFMHIISLLENLKICCEFMSERHPMPINRAQKLWKKNTHNTPERRRNFTSEVKAGWWKDVNKFKEGGEEKKRKGNWKSCSMKSFIKARQMWKKCEINSSLKRVHSKLNWV